MSGWHEGPLLAFDTETTGVDPHTCRIVQIGLTRILPGEGVTQHLWLVDPGVDVPAGAEAVHGLSTEHVREHGRRAAEVLDEVRAYISAWLVEGRPVVAFNAAFDCTLLEAELTRHGLPAAGLADGPVIDPLILHTKTSRIVSRKLGFLCEYYGITLDHAHDAGHDALAAARLAWRLGQVNPALAGMTAAELHEAQKAWRREQTDAKRAEYDGLGWKHDGWDGNWPVQKTPAGVAA